MGVRRLTMPSPDEAREATGYARGTITPLGAGGWRTYVDRLLTVHDEISIGSGRPGWAISISPTDLVAVTAADIVDIAAPPEPG